MNNHPQHRPTSVFQDGRDFYYTDRASQGDMAEAHLTRCTYPGRVSDGDMAAARLARIWFFMARVNSHGLGRVMFINNENCPTEQKIKDITLEAGIKLRLYVGTNGHNAWAPAVYFGGGGGGKGDAWRFTATLAPENTLGEWQVNNLDAGGRTGKLRFASAGGAVANRLELDGQRTTLIREVDAALAEFLADVSIEMSAKAHEKPASENGVNCMANLTTEETLETLIDRLGDLDHDLAAGLRAGTCYPDLHDAIKCKTSAMREMVGEALEAAARERARS